MELSTAAALAISALACLTSIITLIFGRGDKGRDDALWQGKMDAKLDNIMASVTGLRTDVERIDMRLNEHAERIAKVEASAKQAHKRLDELDRRE